ncbi:MAG: hypothetical protein WA051_00265 [Minisyncoccia bacterium]
MNNFEPKTIEALKFMVELFNKHNIPYRIGGGFAAKIYGSSRPLNDIDFGIPDKYFATIFPEISEYITYGPSRYIDGKWDCELITLKYHEQEIDISGTDTMKISNKNRTEWIKHNELSDDGLDICIQGVDVKVMHPRELMKYKMELDGDHQLIDIKATENYLTEHNL